MPNPKKYLDYVGLTEYTSLLKDYISDQQHTIDGYYDVTTTHKFYKNYDAGTFSNEITGAIGNIYVDLLTNKLYKYDNNAYVEIATSDTDTTYELSGAYGDSSNNTWTTTLTPSTGTATTSTVPTATTSAYGITKLENSHSSTSTTTAATPKAVKDAYDLADGKSTVSVNLESTGISAGTITVDGTSNTIKVPIEFDGTYDASTNKAATVSTVTNAISELPEPMVFKGGATARRYDPGPMIKITFTDLPTTTSVVKEGSTFKFTQDGIDYSDIKVGDTFIAKNDVVVDVDQGEVFKSYDYDSGDDWHNDWVLIPSGDEPSGTVTRVAVNGASGGPISTSGSPITSSGTITITHNDSGVTAGTYSNVTVDAKGHVTDGNNTTDLVAKWMANYGYKNVLRSSAKYCRNWTSPGKIWSYLNDCTYDFARASSDPAITAILEVGTFIPSDFDSTIFGNKYIISGCPDNGSTNTYYIRVTDTVTSDTYVDTGSGVEYSSANKAKIELIITTSYTAGTVVHFKPMVCNKILWDASHEYAQPRKSINGIIINNDTTNVYTSQYANDDDKPLVNLQISNTTVGLGNVDNYQQVRALDTTPTTGDIVTWGADGHTVTDSGISVETTLSSTSDTNIPTSKAVATYVGNNSPKDINTVVTNIKIASSNTHPEMSGTILNLFSTDDSTESIIFNTLSIFKDAIKSNNVDSSTAYAKIWNGLSNFIGSKVWTDGENVYYSNTNSSSGTVGQYVLNRATSTWTEKTWNGFNDLRGDCIWTDGKNIYYSMYDEWTEPQHYVLNKSTSTWIEKTWTGLSEFHGRNIWTDGADIYYSNSDGFYGAVGNKVLDISTSTWSNKTWTGLTSFNGATIWTDSANIYYSNYTTQKILNKATSTWSDKTWTGLTTFDSYNIWTDGKNIYCSIGSNQYVLDKSTSTWNTKTWNGLTNFNGSGIWTDNGNIYYSSGVTQYTLVP